MPERGEDIGELVLAAARSWIRTPVRWEQSLKGVGCDCRGLVAGAARDVGLAEAGEIEASIVGYAGRIREANLLAGLARLFDPVPLADRRAGDVLAFRYPARFGRAMTVQHLAIDAGANGRMVHAYMGEPALVLEVPIDRFWTRRLHSAWRWRERELLPSSSAAIGG